jgi:hypothetical protein
MYGRATSGPIHSDDSQIGRSGSSSRHGSRNRRQRHAGRSPPEGLYLVRVDYEAFIRSFESADARRWAFSGTPIKGLSRSHVEEPAEGSRLKYRKSAIADLRTIRPMSGKPDIGGRPHPRIKSGAGSSRRALRALLRMRANTSEQKCQDQAASDNFVVQLFPRKLTWERTLFCADMCQWTKPLAR